MIGETLLHYRVLSKLGEGGMGVVYRAEDAKLKRHVALKVLPARVSDDPVRLKRFRREAEIVAALNHPNIVTVFSIEEADGVHFITMELVEGKSLSELISEGGMPLESFFSIAVPLVEALAAAHAKGIFHRDLKPGNIMVSHEGRLKVLDFGLAKLDPRATIPGTSHEATEALTLEGKLAGTILYMSPEQVTGRTVDERSDIFALGVIFHEMLTGRNAFSHGSSAEIVSSILRDQPQLVDDVRGGLPHHLGRIISHCLRKQPERRYQSAIDLRNDLEDLANEVASPPSSDSRAAVAAEPRGRSRRWLAVVAILAVLGVAAAVWLARLDRGPPTIAEAIAVPPFTNLTADPGQDYLCEGLSAGLITQLAEVGGLRVVGRSESWRYRDQQLSSRALGAALGVEALLEGEVLRHGEALRVDVKLTDARSGLILWADSVSALGSEILSLQSTIARRLIDYLSIPMSFKERRRLARKPTDSARAYDYYLQGQQYLEDRESSESSSLAAEILTQAIELDPDFALAHVALSEALWRRFQEDKDSEDLREAERQARMALDIDPKLAGAQVALARVYRSTGRQEESIADLRQVLARHPKPDEAYSELAASYEQIGNFDEAEKSLRLAAVLGDGYWFNWNNLGSFLSGVGKYDDARKSFERAVALAPPDVVWPLENLGTLYLFEGEFETAIGIYDRLPRPLDAVQASNIGTAYFFAGDIAASEEYFAQAVQLDPSDAELRRNYGDVLLRLERTAEAKRQYEAAVALVDRELAFNPNSRPLQRRRALFAAKADECGEALPQAARLWESQPPTAESAHELAYVFALCERRDEALEAIAAAIRLGFAPALIRQEDEFRSLYDDPEFRRLTEEQAAAG